MDITRLKDFKVELFYEDGIETGGIISSYKPPHPAYFRKGVRTISGYTQFQDNIKTDCIIEFTISFQIKGENDTETETNAKKYLDFIERYSKRFILKNEFGIIYKGYIQNKFDLSTPIEGDIYYINVEMLCNHDISGWVSDSNGI
ncbi:hypothetical protein [Clostridium scatologenes]|uniref:Uncharacterized protein n=1 Tax=Clostridium scatologenes TaxID=1548 RepID=A0A0E3JPA9_CLOSL|nr:hypothetical protein [Clostridium scatologenes]AKA70129.1 hypothetical protein CSCA_3004 [Clostridium scatologenes]